MLPLKLLVFALVISGGVLGRDTHRGSSRYRQAENEYKYNHPPIPENLGAIPVAVVYDNESNREVKSIKSDITQVSNTDDVSKEKTISEPSVRKEPLISSTEAVNSDEISSKSAIKEETEPKVTTYRPQREHQIPVAVVYEQESTYYQKARSNGSRLSNKRRKSQRPAPEEKQSGEEERLSVNTPVNRHTSIDLVSSVNKQGDLNKGQSNPSLVLNKQITVEYDALSSPTPNQTEGETKMQKTQKSGAEETKVPVENKVSFTIPTAETQVPLDKSKNVQRVEAEQNKITQKDNKYTDTEQHVKRNNSTRVREVIPIVQSENVVFSQSGNFKYSYEGGDGTKAFEAGELKTFDDETAGEAVSGGFSFKAKDGNEYSLSYTAHENGYRPVGAHLPTPPPIPPAIARALAYLATKTTPEPVTESIAESDQ